MTTDHDSSTPPIQLQQQYWNNWNVQWREQRPPNSESIQRAEKIWGWFRALPVSQPRILDLGCGNGWFAERLSQFGDVTGVDLAKDVIERAQIRAPHIRFLAGDVLTIPLPEHSFDVVVTMEVLGHLPDHHRFIQRIVSCLKPGGYLLMTTQNKFVLDRCDVHPQGAGQIRTWTDRPALRALLAPHFEILQLETVTPADGHRGCLRLVNSVKLTRLLTLLMSPESLGRIKERMGLGKLFAVMARRLP